MEENIRFRSDFHYDLPIHKEYSRILIQATGRNAFSRCFYTACLIYLILNFNNRFTIFLFMGLSAFYLVIDLVQFISNRNGGIRYKQVLHRNNGQPPKHIVSLDAEGITSYNPGIENTVQDRYSDMDFLIESQNLLVIVTKLKMCHVIDKRSLTGGSRDDLVAFLRQNCPKLKKRIKRGRFSRTVTWIMWSCVALGVLFGIMLLLQLPQRLSGQLTNNMSYQEMADELAPLGIDISVHTVRELEAYDAEFAEEYGSYYGVYLRDSKVFDLLYWEGCGVYNETNWEWTPSESGVYWFDLEVMDCSSIYTDFLRGVNAMDENLSFTNVTEDYSAVDMESGMGIVTFSFDYLDQHYTLNAQYEYDWFDTNMLFHMGRILQQDSDPKDLWYTFDGQGVLLYYGTNAEVLKLNQKTGLYFLDPVHNPLYG